MVIYFTLAEQSERGSNVNIMNSAIDTETAYLFDHDWFTWDYTEEEGDEYLERADVLIEKYGWPAVFERWFDYLVTNCKTPIKVISFAHLFWWYGGQDHPIPDPHRFLAYFYTIVLFDPAPYDEQDILDSLACHILSRAGFREADDLYNPYYQPLDDPKIIDAAIMYWGYCPKVSG